MYFCFSVYLNLKLLVVTYKLMYMSLKTLLLSPEMIAIARMFLYYNANISTICSLGYQSDVIIKIYFYFC